MLLAFLSLMLSSLFWVAQEYTLLEEWLQYMYKGKAQGKVKQKAAQHLTATHNTVLI
jgi:hypothetical protein